MKAVPAGLWVAVLSAVVAISTSVRAESHPRSYPAHAPFDPIVHQLPGVGAVPTTLGMRVDHRALAQPAGDSSDSTSDPANRAASGGSASAPGGDVQPESELPGDPLTGEATLSLAERKRRQERAIFGQKPLSDRVIFRINIGYGVDGSEPVESSDGSRPELTDYARLRTYTYGDVVIGSRGLISPSLSTYLASQFRFDQKFDGATPIPTRFDAEVVDDLKVTVGQRDVWVRSGYATWQGVSNIRSLRPLYIRAGRQFRYGPAIAHFDGLTIGYDGPAFSFGAFAGESVDVTGVDLSKLYREGGVLSGLDARLDLYRIVGAPLVLTGELLRFDDTTHLSGALALRINRDIALRATVRARGNEIARTGIRLRARVRRVTLIDVQVENRSASDWMYDIFAASTTTSRPEVMDNPLDFFQLGRVVPRLYVEARAGTVLLRNVDVLVHGRGALRQGPDDVRSPFAASFAQGGAAVEVHVRRSINLGLGFLARRYWREEQTIVTTPDSFPDYEGMDLETDAVGELFFTEGNANVRYSLGARRFSAGAEVYLRAYDFQSSFAFPETSTEDYTVPERLSKLDLRGGGRFTVEGWAGDNLRLKAEYDVTTGLVVAPRLSGIKSLRMLAEGRF